MENNTSTARWKNPVCDTDINTPPKEECVDDHNPWIRIASEAFFDTVNVLTSLKVKSGVDRNKALRTINLVLLNRQYPHEVKLRQAATLMQEWCEAGTSGFNAKDKK